MTDAADGGWPSGFKDEAALEDYMTTPDARLVDDLAALDGDILVLGVGGKMGPTLTRMAKRAAPDKRVIGVARFSEAGLEDKLKAADVETIRCDLLDRDAVAALPKVPNVVFMAGRKFGTAGNTSLTWAMNVYMPGIVAEAFRESRIVAFSTGNVYPFVNPLEGGATEAVPAQPVGEYAQSCLGRERVFEHFSNEYGTPGRLIRLNYAIDMRYGVIYDIARRVHAREPIDLATGSVNVIWQGDANSQILRSLRHCTTPASPLNVSGPENISIRQLAHAFGERFDVEPVLQGAEAERCWLVNSTEAARLFGNPSVPLGRMIDWVGDWVARGGSTYDKPTAYESREGAF